MTRRIYAYTVIGKDAEPWRRKIGRALVEGAGLIKVGETTKSTARARIKQQLGTAYPDLEGVNILLDEPATREDGSQFGDRGVHAALVAAVIKPPGGEWFECTLGEGKPALHTVRTASASGVARWED